MNRCVLVDKNIPFLDEFTPEGVKLFRFDPEDDWSLISTEFRKECEALIVRTVSRIDKDHFDIGLFPSLKFVGTASAGYDHIDVAYLKSNGIDFSDAGGANAQAVGEYVASVIVQWSIETGKPLEDCSIGIVGFGHTGSAVGSIMGDFGCKIIPHDPPKALREDAFKSYSLDDVLHCDVITFHVPLNNNPNYPTYYWMGTGKFKLFQGSLIINAARGGVVEESALLDWFNGDSHNRRFVLDVWENEPRLNKLVAELAWISTPHIAGYSIQSKRNATRMIMKSMCNYLQIPNMIGDSCTSFLNLNQYQNWHPLFELSDSLKQGLTDDLSQNASHFRFLRQHSKLRNEFRFVTPGKFEKLVDFPRIQKLIKICGGPL